MKSFFRLITLLIMVGFAVPAISYGQTVTMDKVDGTSNLPDFLQYKSYGNVRTDYSIPHRTKDEILNWSMQHVAELMTFDARNLSEHFKRIQAYFVRSGWQDFISYVQQTKLREEIYQSNYSLISIVNGQPYVKREGPLGGVYRWVIEMPVLMSFYKLDDYGNPQKDISATARINITMTVTRVSKGGGRDMVAISKWKVTGGDSLE